MFDLFAVDSPARLTFRKAAQRFLPPLNQPLSEWMEENVVLPEGLAAMSGPIRLWGFQVAIADAISDPEIERVTVLKCARVGYSTLLIGTIANFVANQPSPIMVVLPTEKDCRDFIVSDFEPIVEGTPSVAKLIGTEADENGRNTMTHKRFPGGSLKVVPARSPRNLRKHTVRVLLIDEEDGIEMTKEGNALDLAIKRTTSFPNRKIIRGSTPTDVDTSTISAEYLESDMRIYEIKCFECGDYSEPRWEHIHWEKERDADGAVLRHLPNTAKWACPKCGCLIEERHKAQMVADGGWRATAPHVIGHAGFKLNALISPHFQASWRKLAANFLAVKNDPDRLRVFKNTELGEPWAESVDTVDYGELATRAEPFGLNRKQEDGTVWPIPEEVLSITAGVDVQEDRFEVTIIGWDRKDVAFILDHIVVWGRYVDDTAWRALDEALLQKYRHPYGRMLAIDATCVDSSDGSATDYVYSFCWPRAARHIMAIKGRAGRAKDLIWMSSDKVANGKLDGRGRLWLIGVDRVKSIWLSRLSQYKELVRFSKALPLSWYEQATSEKRVVKMVMGQPTTFYERIKGRAAEGLDCTVYAFAAHSWIAKALNLDAREAFLRSAMPVPGSQPTARQPQQRVVKNPYMD